MSHRRRRHMHDYWFHRRAQVGCPQTPRVFINNERSCRNRRNVAGRSAQQQHHQIATRRKQAAQGTGSRREQTGPVHDDNEWPSIIKVEVAHELADVVGTHDHWRADSIGRVRQPPQATPLSRVVDHCCELPVGGAACSRELHDEAANDSTSHARRTNKCSDRTRFQNHWVCNVVDTGRGANRGHYIRRRIVAEPPNSQFHSGVSPPNGNREGISIATTHRPQRTEPSVHRGERSIEGRRGGPMKGLRRDALLA